MVISSIKVEDISLKTHNASSSIKKANRAPTSPANWNSNYANWSALLLTNR